MRMKTVVAAGVCTFVTAASAMLAAPDQTQQPGQMTQAHVWVQNRGRGEAVPVDLSDVNLSAPLRVQVVNGEPGPGTTTNPVLVRVIRQPRIWDYQTITVKPDQDLAQALSARGVAGWETTGIMLANADGTTLVLKRLR